MPGSQYQVTRMRLSHSLYSLTDSSDGSHEEEQGNTSLRLTPLQKLTAAMCKRRETIKELIIGRRVGFYKVRGEIGYGTFSRVKLSFHALTKDKVALKILDRARLDACQRLLSREISSMESLQHPNVIRLYEVVETPSRLFLVLEYAGGGDLHNRICSEGKLCDNTSKITFAQVLSAVKYMHNMNIIHRDLKSRESSCSPAGGCVKVADFGFSTRVSGRGSALDTFCGSPPYAAPELFKDDCYLGPPVDVWAMGVLLFFMVTGTMPFRADTMGKLRRCIIGANYTIPPWVPGPCQRLIRGILKPVPAERYAVDQMLGCDWLLPVEFPWTLVPFEPPSPLQGLLESERGTLEEEEEVEEEVRSALEELGFTAEHLQNHQLTDSRSPVTGVYRILLHRAQKRWGCDSPPVVRGMVRDPKREGLRAYRGLRHTSKFCVLS
ncbi:LOW QUALITY PROTEIN: serine/threonine-protein kinase NIM1 [Anableps anableps]